jgi:hypothetical protein
MTTTVDEIEEVPQILKDQGARAAMYARAEELAAYTAALSVSAASLFAPVLRCPPQIDRVRDLLIRLAGMARSGPPNVERRSKLARNIGETLRRYLPQTLLHLIERHQHEGIKLIGDTPLELMPVNDLPIGLRATTSRLPTLPGNLLMRHALFRAPIFVQPEDLTPVLVVRAFDPGDPLRHLLVRSVQQFNRDISKPIELRVVDVLSKEEFAAAFNDFDGPIAIFDGHGAHNRTDPQGTITVGPVRFNPLELYGKIRVPPIVFLSACETHALEGFESSVASAFLMLGSRSVLGTLVPIEGLNAAILMARFLFRFTNFLPFIRSTMPWTEVVTGMMRMSYVTDVLRSLEKQYSFSEEVYRAIHTAANIAINEFRADWFEQVIESVAKTMSVPETQVREKWLQTCYFTDTLHYVHLGQPEHLFVKPSESIKEQK